ncbi:hypothetical protein [Aneurinibacillus tyrosinisolvens]|uniref:hypothetical protein n=1 Tax=Aneurinibacillus tyrosinisolvens TaxID=1443435 RepID=UPI00063F047A|nr:hypothetical protein [Aneurinibacillus tyrosinisolvens]
MRLLDNDTSKSLRNVILYLKLEEANELKADLERLIDSFGNNEHVHINDLNFNHEITVVLYNESNLKGFDERSIKLIKEDL